MKLLYEKSWWDPKRRVLCVVSAAWGGSERHLMVPPQSHPQRWPYTWSSFAIWQHQGGFRNPSSTSKRPAKSFWRRLNSYWIRASHNHCQSKLCLTNCSSWKFYNPKTRIPLNGYNLRQSTNLCCLVHLCNIRRLAHSKCLINTHWLNT